MKSLLQMNWIVILVYFGPTLVVGQNQDSLWQTLHGELTEQQKVRTYQELFYSYIGYNPDSALLCAHRAFDLSNQLDDDDLHGRSLQIMGHAYYRSRHFDSTKLILLRESIPFYTSTGQFSDVAASYRNLAAVGEKLGQPDTSLIYLDKCLEVLKAHPDTNIMGQVYLSQGFAYRTKGFYELSIQALLKSLRIFEALQNSKRLGYVTQNLGITYGQANRMEQAIKYTEKSIEHSKEVNNLRAVAQSLNNLGLQYKHIENISKASASHHRSIPICKKTNQPTVLLNNYFNLGKLYYESEQLDSSLYYFNLVQDMANDMEINFYRSANLRTRALISLRQNQPSAASRFLQRAEQIPVQFVDPQENIEAFEELAEITESLGQHEKSLNYWQRANVIIDSVYLLKRDQQIEELNLIYQTEKKDAEIALLNKNAEVDAAKRRGLLFGMGALALAALAIIYSLFHRKRKQKEILLKEKEVETEKRKNAEQELEFKKKELTAKVLQLAHKNEFLQSLQGEVSQLRSSIDDSVSATSRRISRMIQHDSSEDDEWNQFAKEFSSIHQGFIDRLVEKHGQFSKNELRLIALLKMNLSSKDIANTLRISADGIKKARYRLRKKLGLESNVDLQGYILSF